MTFNIQSNILKPHSQCTPFHVLQTISLRNMSIQQRKRKRSLEREWNQPNKRIKEEGKSDTVEFIPI